MCACVLSHFSGVWFFVTPWTVGSSVHVISRQEYWSGLPHCPPGDLPDPGLELVSHVSCFGRQVLYHSCHLGSPIFSICFPKAIHSAPQYKTKSFGFLLGTCLFILDVVWNVRGCVLSFFFSFPVLRIPQAICPK